MLFSKNEYIYLKLGKSVQEVGVLQFCAFQHNFLFTLRWTIQDNIESKLKHSEIVGIK